MGTHIHPLEGAVLDLFVIRTQLVEDFTADDGAICETEQDILNDFDQVSGVVKHVRAVERASELTLRQGPQGLTDYGKRQWELAGLKVEPLGAA